VSAAIGSNTVRTQAGDPTVRVGRLTEHIAPTQALGEGLVFES
jgi:hypothetical protein